MSLRKHLGVSTVCNVLTCFSGVSLIWANEIRDLCTFIVKSRLFTCSLDSAKRSFHRAANAVFGKIGRIASEEVNLQVIKSKCLPVLLGLYGLEMCPLTVYDLHARDSVVNRFLFMKLFSMNVMDMVKICQDYFNFELSSSRSDGKDVPEPWNDNSCAGKDWLCNSMKRSNSFCLRTPEPTSFSRATAWNKQTKEEFLPISVNLAHVMIIHLRIYTMLTKQP